MDRHICSIFKKLEIDSFPNNVSLKYINSASLAHCYACAVECLQTILCILGIVMPMEKDEFHFSQLCFWIYFACSKGGGCGCLTVCNSHRFGFVYTHFHC